MWVCRAGKDSIYFDTFIDQNIIAIPWDGYGYSFEDINSREEIKKIVKNETKSDNRTSISNWAGQLFSFCCEMKVGDYVVIQSFRSRKYVVARIKSNYQYVADKELKHIREIEIICNDIQRDDLSQSLQYSLGAFRTIFKVYDDEILCKVEGKNIED